MARHPLSAGFGHNQSLGPTPVELSQPKFSPNTACELTPEFVPFGFYSKERASLTGGRAQAERTAFYRDFQPCGDLRLSGGRKFP